MHQHVSFQDPFVRRHKAALRAAVCFLVGMKVANVLIELYRVESGKRTEAAAQLLLPWMSLSFVLQKTAFIRAGEVTVWAVVGLMRAEVFLHLFSAPENGTAGVMMAPYGLNSVSL